MPYSHSLNSIRKDLAKIIPNRQKREFIAGHLEEHAVKTGTGSRITPPALNSALKKLEMGHGTGINPWERITKEDLTKIQGHFSLNPPRKI